MNHKLKKLFTIILALLMLTTSNLSLVSYALAQTDIPVPTQESQPTSPNPTASPVSPTVLPTTVPTSIPPSPLPTVTAPTSPMLPSPSPTNLPQSSPLPDLPIFELELTPTTQANLKIDSVSIPSASFRLPRSIRTPTKHLYKADEEVSVTIENVSASQLTAELFTASGKQVHPLIKYDTISSNTTISIIPYMKLTPGKYTLKITDDEGKTYNQDFFWGVLALNLDKSIYSPDELAHVAIAVLDEQGRMVCDAQISLTIINQTENVKRVLSTASGDIVANPECFSHEVTTRPDYETSFPVGKEGNYSLQLKATTNNGEFEILDGFKVKTNIPFAVSRKAATRIYPPNPYPVLINITANQDFSGSVVETLPDSFTVSPSREGKTYDEVSIVSTASIDKYVLGTENININYPFVRPFVETLAFGDDLTDPFLRQFYKENGLIGHDGIDFGLPIGTPVIAADDGEVILAGWGAYGITVVLQHPWGRTYYGHLSDTAVKKGDKVKKGDELGKSGTTGFSTGPHLHFSLKLNKAEMSNGYYGKIDPRPFLTSIANISNTSVKVIIWNINIKKGETLQLGYSYRAPAASPQFYLTGPLRFYTNDPSLSSSSLEATPEADINPFILGKQTEDLNIRFGSDRLIFSETRQWQIAVDAVSNNGTFVYSDTADANPDDLNFRTYTAPTTVGSETNTVNTTDTNIIVWTRIAAAPTREEKMAVHLKATGRMDILTCTTGCDATGDWTLRGTYSTVTTDANAETYPAFDVAYEQLSGLATVIFTDDNTTGTIYYCQWDGTSWSPSPACGATFSPDTSNDIDLTGVGVTGQPRRLRLVSRGERFTPYRTDEFLIGVSDSASDLFLARWDGSAVQNAANPYDTLNGPNFDLAWEETTGEGLAVFGNSVGVSDKLHYSVYTSASGWGSATDGPTNNPALSDGFDGSLQAASDPLSDDISVITQDNDNDTEYFIWNGSSWLEGTDDLSVSQCSRSSTFVTTAWTRFSQRALFLYSGTSSLYHDMQCWTSGGGFSSVVTQIGNPDIGSAYSIEGVSIAASPNNNRIMLLRNDVAADLYGLTYSDSTGCADGDWSQIGSGALGLNVENGLNNTDCTVRTYLLAHWPAYTPYSAWSRNWRFYKDVMSNDPSEALYRVGENQSALVLPEQFIRLRFQVAELGGMEQSNARKKLQYATCADPDSSNCTWTDVGDTGETTAVWRYATSGETCSSCTDGTAIANPRLTGTDQTGNGFYVSDKDAAAGENMDHSALKKVEIDYPLKAEAVTVDTKYYFRIYDVDQQGQVFRRQDSGTTDCLSATCAYPSITIISLEDLMRHGNWFSSDGVEQSFLF